MSKLKHVPVMLNEVLSIYGEHIDSGRSNLRFIDATLGAGGHAKAVLDRYPGCELVGFDQDAAARDIAETTLADYAGRLTVIPGNFSSIADLRLTNRAYGADGVLFDLGVSNMQLTEGERGFSYQQDGPLDMRMDRTSAAESAGDILRKSVIRELTGIFREYGEERHAYVIARGIVRARERGELPETTEGLTSLIRAILPAPVQRKMGTHPARRVFQALRIAVNSELEVLTEGLNGALAIAADRGVIIVISYHSLEDRIVKRSFIKWAGEDRGAILTRRPLLPSESEVEENRSARSAKLRAFKVRKIHGGSVDESAISQA